MKSPAAAKHRQEHVPAHRAVREPGRVRQMGRRLISARHQPTVESAPNIEVAPQSPLYFGSEKPQKLQKSELLLGDRPPLLSRDDVHEQAGVDIGALAAVISLPRPHAIPAFYKGELKLYCFDRSQTDSQGRRSPSFWLMTAEQISQARSWAQTGEPHWGEIAPGIVQINEGNPSHEIGRKAWLPGLGTDTHLLDHDRELSAQYETISRHHAVVGLDETGGLSIRDLGGINGTSVYCAQPVVNRDALEAHTGELVAVR
jgi:hypothetical protein